MVGIEQVSRMEMRDPAALGMEAIVGARIRPSNDLVGEEERRLRYLTHARGQESPDVQEEVYEM